jgi:hypothetical protein
VRRDWSEVWVGLSIVLILVGTIGAAVAQPYFEARTFNRCTGGSATYWDAVWADLRVMDCRPEVKR